LTFAAKPTPRGRFRKTPSSPPRLSTFNLWMLPPACRAMKFSDGVALRCESANGMGKSINSDVLTISAESASGQTFICFFRCRHGGFYQGVEAENVCVTTCRARACQFFGRFPRVVAWLQPPRLIAVAPSAHFNSAPASSISPSRRGRRSSRWRAACLFPVRASLQSSCRRDSSPDP